MSLPRITRRSECSDLLGLDQLDLYCDRCTIMHDINNGPRKISGARKKECMRLWDDKWASSRELRWQLKHSKVRHAIGYPENIPLEYECVYKKSTKESNTTNDNESKKTENRFKRKK